MNSASKIQRAHLERLAIVYVRQSSLAQVYGHTESTARQYALADDATRLGWEASRIVVIDADLGISGRTATARAGFRELVGRVCVGEVGARSGPSSGSRCHGWREVRRICSGCSSSAA
jgi:hypothetical protein